ncbi:MAG: lipoprotein signal peptidase [Bacteroidetes bacterium]|nr:lipoprotein signal peptidase [Bacteroidota bacterium]
MKKALAIAFAVLFIDQSIKIWIKTTMHLGQAYEVSGHWFFLHFVENPGMAFGLTLSDGAWGKLLLSIFRLLAVAGIGYYLWTLFRKNVRPLLVVCVALIFAGAMGNIIDSVFYGKFFTASDPWDQNVSQLVANGKGYAGFLHGQVVDMFYFPVYTGHFPKSFPFWGGEEFCFFRPVFNIADASISVGVFLLIIFQKRLFGKLATLPEKKILTTNIFFGCIFFLISSFLLLTYFTLFSKIHPLSGMKIGLVFLLAAAAGTGMFYFLQRYPRFIPDEEEIPAKVDVTEKEQTDATSASTEIQGDQNS